jgi:hypothetical protein
VDVFTARGFFLVAGTEHNSPGHDPIAVRCKGAPLPADARGAFSRGACVLAAHQYLRARGESRPAERLNDRKGLDEMADLGARVIRAVLASTEP